MEDRRKFRGKQLGKEAMRLVKSPGLTRNQAFMAVTKAASMAFLQLSPEDKREAARLLELYFKDYNPNS